MVKAYKEKWVVIGKKDPYTRDKNADVLYEGSRLGAVRFYNKKSKDSNTWKKYTQISGMKKEKFERSEI